MTTSASEVPHLEAREAMPNLFLKLEQVPISKESNHQSFGFRIAENLPSGVWEWRWAGVWFRIRVLAEWEFTWKRLRVHRLWWWRWRGTWWGKLFWCLWRKSTKGSETRHTLEIKPHLVIFGFKDAKLPFLYYRLSILGHIYCFFLYNLQRMLWCSS